jgi:hypothetical protein
MDSANLENSSWRASHPDLAPSLAPTPPRTLGTNRKRARRLVGIARAPNKPRIASRTRTGGSGSRAPLGEHSTASRPSAADKTRTCLHVTTAISAARDGAPALRGKQGAPASSELGSASSARATPLAAQLRSAVRRAAVAAAERREVFGAAGFRMVPRLRKPAFGVGAHSRLVQRGSATGRAAGRPQPAAGYAEHTTRGSPGGRAHTVDATSATVALRKLARQHV